MNRRAFLGTAAASLAAARAALAGPQQTATPARKGRLKQGVTRGVFGRGVPLEDCCRQAASVGIQGFDLITPADWPLVKKYGLVPSMASGGGGSIASALNRTENHEKIVSFDRKPGLIGSRSIVSIDVVGDLPTEREVIVHLPSERRRRRS